MRNWIISSGPHPLPAGAYGWEWVVRRGARTRTLRVVVDPRAIQLGTEAASFSVPPEVADIVAAELHSASPSAVIHLTRDELSDAGAPAWMRYREMSRFAAARDRAARHLPAWLKRRPGYKR